MWQNKKLAMVLGGSAAAGLVISVSAHFEPRFPGDLPATLLFQSVHSQALLAFMKAVSYMAGDWRAAVLVVVSAGFAWRCIGRLEGVMLLFSGVVATINELFKLVVDRPRPTADLVNVLVSETGKSFPSGHAFFSVVVLGLMAYLIAAHQSRCPRIFTISVFVLFILLVGISRIYLGVHWTSDVIGGYVAGTLFLILEIWLYRWLKLRYHI